MQKSVDLARKISDDLEKMWVDEIKDINLHKTFEPILRRSHHRLKTINTIICYIIFAYDNDSNWLSLNRDRLENKVKIIQGLGADMGTETFSSIVNNEDEEVLEVINDYLVSQTTWKWQQIMTQIEYHAKMMRFVNQKTEEEKQVDKLTKEGNVKTLTTEYDIDMITKVNKQKGELLDQALKARRDADTLLSEIKKEFVNLDNVTQAEFGFEITDERKINPESWRDFIKQRNSRIKEKNA